MSPQGNLKRKLTAIMFTDISGFTSIASKNEQSALELLDLQRDTLTPIIENHCGTIHKELGDGLLISFPLTSEAVKCGIAIQISIKLLKPNWIRPESFQISLTATGFIATSYSR